MLTAVLLTAPAITGCTAQPGMVPKPANLVYAPPSLDKTKKYPLFVVLNPAGDSWSHMQLLTKLADEHQWILAGDDSYRNGQDMESMRPAVMETIRKVRQSYPVDPNNIFIGGISGGAMGAYYFVYKDPNLFKGIIANTGMMPWASDAPANGAMPTDFPWKKNIVMLASPEDFRFKAMLRNRTELQQRAWNIKWIEFPGGHTAAPETYYDEAFGWLSKQPNATTAN